MLLTKPAIPTATPDWLTQHGGELRASKDGQSWAVYFADGPQYFLILAPNHGRFGCKVIQSINGKRLDSGAAYLSPDEAFKGGLDDLRKALGW
jgi:hypothetical protein